VATVESGRLPATPTNQETRWTPGPVWTSWKGKYTSPVGNRTKILRLSMPLLNGLYRLCHPGSHFNRNELIVFISLSLGLNDSRALIVLLLRMGRLAFGRKVTRFGLLRVMRLDEVGRACGTYGEEENYVWSFC
jgi:hypothetical protein